MPTTTVVPLLALLLGIQPVATDLYLPALPTLTRDLAGSLPQAQLTLTALVLAFGCSQLVWGPLSDRFGRKPILLAGLSAFTLAALASLMATSITALIVCRALQGAAMGASVMGARALIRDLYEPQQGARVMARGLTGLGIIVCASAPLGALLTEWWHWRAALTLPALFGAATLAAVALRLRETVTVFNPQALQPAVLLRTWAGILRHRTFWAYSLLSVASYAGLFTFLAASSFIFTGVLGVSRPVYGFLIFTMALAYIAGTLVCRRLLARTDVRHAVALAGGLSLAGGTLMGVLPLLGIVSPLSVIAPFYLFMLAHGIHQPCGQSGAVGPFPRAAGAASALNGCLMMATAFAVGGWVGQRLDGTVAALTNGLWLWGTVIAAIAWTLVQRHGQQPALTPSAVVAAAAAPGQP